jgi:hypothetical protein
VSKISEAIEELVVATRAAGYSEQTADFYMRKLKPLVAYLKGGVTGPINPHAWRHGCPWCK